MNSKHSKEKIVGGNTKNPTIPKKKQVSPGKYWCFTLNNWTEDELVNIVNKSKNFKYIIGKEIGEGGTPHLQGYIEADRLIRPITHYAIKRIHWEKRAPKATAMDNIKYCSKDGDYIMAGLMKPPRSVKIIAEDKLYQWEKDILEIISVEPDDRTIYWYYNAKAGCGKTTFCKYLIQKHGAIVLGGKGADMKNGIINYMKEHEREPELICVNLPMTFDTAYLSYTGIEECKDMMFYSGKYEGGQVCGNCPHLIIFSNEKPSMEAMDVKRWKVYNIDEARWEILGASQCIIDEGDDM